jgi:hypothetical protein
MERNYMKKWKSEPINVIQSHERDKFSQNTKLIVIAGAMVLWTVVFWGYQYLK